MKNTISKLKQQRGVSLLEVLVAVVITGVVTLAVFKVYITQHHHYIVQEDVTDIQQNARAAIDEITKHVRMAGYDLPGIETAITPSNTDPDTITLTYNTGNCETALSADMSLPSSILECDSDVSCFSAGQWAYIYEAAVDSGEWFEISLVETGSQRLQHGTMSLARKYDAGSEVMSMTQVKFYIDTSDADHPNLMMQYMGQAPQVYAMNISDLQFQYFMKNGVIQDNPVLVDDIREVMISITGRSHNADPDAPDTTDPYRTRNFATSVHLRNLGI